MSTTQPLLADFLVKECIYIQQQPMRPLLSPPNDRTKATVYFKGMERLLFRASRSAKFFIRSSPMVLIPMLERATSFSGEKKSDVETLVDIFFALPILFRSRH